MAWLKQMRWLNSKKKKSQNGQQKHLLMFLTKVSYVSIFFNNITYKSLRHLIYQVMYSGNTYKKEIKKRKKKQNFTMLSFSRFAHVVLKWPSHLPIYMAHYVHTIWLDHFNQIIIIIHTNQWIRPGYGLNLSWFSRIWLYVIGKKIQPHFFRWLISIDKYICVIYN
jgi:type IV secretory pathway TrbD component